MSLVSRLPPEQQRGDGGPIHPDDLPK